MHKRGPEPRANHNTEQRQENLTGDDRLRGDVSKLKHCGLLAGGLLQLVRAAAARHADGQHACYTGGVEQFLEREEETEGQRGRDKEEETSVRVMQHIYGMRQGEA